MQTFTPFKHQLEAIEQLKIMETIGFGGFLSDSPGMGKTATMSMFLKKYKFDMPDLIICPKSVLYVWEREITRVYECLEPKKDKPRILVNTGIKREINLAKKWDFVIVSYSTITTDLPHLIDKFWGRIVLDESHIIRNGIKTKSGFAKSIFELKDLSRYRYCLSATPYNNRISDVASQAYFIGTSPYDEVSWWKKNKNNQEILSIWKDKFVIKRTKEGLLKPPIYHTISVNPTNVEEKLIQALKQKTKKMLDEWQVAKARKDNSERMRLQACILALITQLRQISNSYFCIEDSYVPEVQEITENCAKVSSIITNIDKCLRTDKKRSVVVFSQFTSFLDIIELMLEEELCGVDIYRIDGSKSSKHREEAIKGFNESKDSRVMLISLMAGGTGISLHQNCSNVFICEPYFNPFVELQAEERVHRLGQTEQVNVYRFKMENSIEEWLEMLKAKKNESAHMLDMSKSGLPVSTGITMEDLKELFRSKVYVSDKELS